MKGVLVSGPPVKGDLIGENLQTRRGGKGTQGEKLRDTINL